MNHKIVITGANGTIGTVAVNGLKHVTISPLVKPHIDIRKYADVAKGIKGNDVVIHLAWDTNRDNDMSQNFNSDNSKMFYNIYQAALEQKVPRVIMASSVHADSFHQWNAATLLSPDKTPIPDSPYGAEKVFMESLGRYYATRGLEVICIRFGGINRENKPHESNISERKVYLSHRDCCNLLQSIISATHIPQNFSLVYGVSNNAGRIHDVVNPFGWYPVDGAADIH